MHQSLIGLVAAATLLVSFGAQAGSGEWEYVDRFDGVKVWRMQREGSNVFAFRGEVIHKVHIGKVLSVFGNGDLRQDWVDRWDASKDLKMIGPDERVFWIRFDLNWPVSDRDYVIHTKATKYPKRRQLIARLKSTTHRAKPEDGGCCVRGLAFGTLYKFSALPDGRTKMMVEVHTDPQGMLPAWLVNLIQKKWPSKTLNGLAKRAKKGDIGVREGFEDWHTPYVEPAPEPPAPVAAPETPAAPVAPEAPAVPARP